MHGACGVLGHGAAGRPIWGDAQRGWVLTRRRVPASSPLSFKDITALELSCMAQYGGPVFPYIALGGYPGTRRLAPRGGMSPGGM